MLIINRPFPHKRTVNVKARAAHRPYPPAPSTQMPRSTVTHSYRQGRQCHYKSVGPQVTVGKEAWILAQRLNIWHLPNPSLGGISAFFNVDNKIFKSLVCFALLWLPKQIQLSAIVVWSTSEQGLSWTQTTAPGELRKQPQCGSGPVWGWRHSVRPRKLRKLLPVPIYQFSPLEMGIVAAPVS